MRTHLIKNHQALRDSAPCLSRAATLPKATKLELGRGAHLKTPSSANHTAAASQPTGRIAKAVSWLHLSRVSPALLPPERPSHTHTPKPGFGGRGHECTIILHYLSYIALYAYTVTKCFQDWNSSTFGGDRDQETVQITSNGWRAGISLDNFWEGAGGRRSLVVRSLSVILTLQPKFLNRVRSCVDL